jgi:hypothetical protein
VNLPFRLMIPNEEDSISVLAAKFKSLGTGNLEPVDVCNVLEPYLLRAYSDITSSAIRAFSCCVRRCLEKDPYDRSHELLRKILFESDSFL